MTPKQEQVYNENKFLLNTPDPVSLIETIDRIRELRDVADREVARNHYDPQGYTQEMAKVFRELANELELHMEREIGWVRPSASKPL